MPRRKFREPVPIPALDKLLLRVRALLRSRQNKRDLDRALAYIEAVEPEGVSGAEDANPL